MMKKKKLLIPCILVGLLCLVLCACSADPVASNTGSNNVAEKTPSALDSLFAPDPLDEFDSPYREIFELFEAGEYAKADQQIKEDIIGNLNREEEAKEIVLAYEMSMIKRFNDGTLDAETIRQIERCIEKTEFWAYATGMVGEDVANIGRSKELYQMALEYGENEDYQSAFDALLQIHPLDSNYVPSLHTVCEYMHNICEKDDFDSMKLTLDMNDYVAGLVEAALSLTPEEADSLELLSDEEIRTTKTAFAAALVEANQYRYAIQQYAQLALDYDDGEAEDKFTELMREVNAVSVGEGGPYFLTVNQDGKVEKAEDGNGFLTPYNAQPLQIATFVDSGTYGYWEGMLLRIMDPDYVHTYMSSSWEDSHIYSALADEISATEGITKLLGASHPDRGTVALMADGTVHVFLPQDLAFNWDHVEMMEWKDLIDIYAFGYDGYIGITANGSLYITSDLLNEYPALMEALAWEDIVAVTKGDATFTDIGIGYYGTVFQGLTSTGGVYYIDDYKSDDSYLTGYEDVNAVAIASGYYLSESGELNSLFGWWQSFPCCGTQNIDGLWSTDNGRGYFRPKDSNEYYQLNT